MAAHTAAKVDVNQPAIVKTLRAIGATVLHTHQLKNCFNIFVGYRGRTFLMGIKATACSKDGDHIHAHTTLKKPLYAMQRGF